MAEFMKDRIGEVFTGRVSGMTEWGMYVELDENHVEGMVFLRDIDDDDYYRFDEARYEVVGRSSGIRLTLGSPVRVRVKGVDMNRRTLDFQLLLDSNKR
jgi:ribonuclease R